jgi:hypothetical protein
MQAGIKQVDQSPALKQLDMWAHVFNPALFKKPFNLQSENIII